MDFNSVVLIGRLTRDPELKYVPSGAPVCSFSVATNRKWTTAEGQKAEEVSFFDVDVWKKLAETCAMFLKKGRPVLVLGSLKQSRWTDSATQQTRSRIRIVAQQVQFLGPKPDNGQADSPPPEEEPVPVSSDVQ